jgi:hypothetical protein
MEALPAALPAALEKACHGTREPFGAPNGVRRLRADDGIRTRDPHLGKVMLYQLSHVRVPALEPVPARAVPGVRTEL